MHTKDKHHKFFGNAKQYQGALIPMKSVSSIFLTPILHPSCGLVVPCATKRLFNKIPSAAVILPKSVAIETHDHGIKTRNRTGKNAAHYPGVVVIDTKQSNYAASLLRTQ
jgi:hypothetical protein